MLALLKKKEKKRKEKKGRGNEKNVDVTLWKKIYGTKYSNFPVKCCGEKEKKKEEKMEEKRIEGALGVEPRTYRSAVDCSTTELYTQGHVSGTLVVTT